MCTKNLNKFLSIIIYVLIITLTCLIFYNSFLLIKKISYSSQSHKNSIKVGPISTE
jgi:hypothetical protein